MKRFVAPAVLVFAIVACNATPAQPTSPSSPQTIGVLNLKVNQENGAGAAQLIASKLGTQAFTSQNPTDALQICDVSSSVLETTSQVRFIGAIVTFKNKLNTPLTNLTFHAVNPSGNSSGTAIQNLRNFGQNSLTDIALARAMKPTHLMTATGVNQNYADLQIYTAAERQDLQNLYNTAFPNNPVNFLDYGFVAHQSNDNRTIAAADNSSCGTDTASTGRVAVSFRVPSSATLSNDVYRFELRFALMTDDQYFVTESIEEQDPAYSNALFDRYDRIVAANTPNIIDGKVMPGSRLNGGIFVCGVMTATGYAASLDGRIFGNGVVTPSPNSMFSPASTNIAATFPFPLGSGSSLVVHGLQGGTRTSGYSSLGNTITQTNSRPFFAGEEVEVSQTVQNSFGLRTCSESVSRFRVASSPAVGFVQEGKVNTGGRSPVALGYAGSSNPLQLGLLAGDVSAVYRYSQVGPLGNQSLATLGFGGSSTVTAIKSADLNADGLPDIVSLYASTMAVSLDGQTATDYTLPDLGNDLTVGDINNDGKLDIVVAVKLNPNQIFLNDGNGGLRTPIALGRSDRRAVALGDLNNDGNLDWVAINQNSITRTLFDGNFNIIASNGITSTSANSLALADINQDGKLDIITASNLSVNPVRLSVLLNLGNGTFSSPTDYTGPNSPLNASFRSISLKIADMDGNGTLDAVMLTDATLSVFLGRNDGTFGERTDLELQNFPLSFDIGDLDGNGTLDLVVGNVLGVSWYSSGTPSNTRLNPSIAFLPLSSSRTFGITNAQGTPVQIFQPSTSSNTNIATVAGRTVSTTSSAGTATITAYTGGPSSQVISSSNPLLGALDLTGSAARVTVPHDDSLNLDGNYTIEFWARIPSGAATTQGVLLEKRNSSGNYPFSFRLENGVLVVSRKGSSPETITTPNPFQDGNWHHIALTRVVTRPTFGLPTATQTVYVDGTVFGQSLVAQVNSQTANTAPVTFGADSSNTTHAPVQLDDVRFWNLARTAGQISSARNAPLPSTDRAGLIGYFQMDEINALTVKNEINPALNGALETGMAGTELVGR